MHDGLKRVRQRCGKQPDIGFVSRDVYRRTVEVCLERKKATHGLIKLVEL